MQTHVFDVPIKSDEVVRWGLFSDLHLGMDFADVPRLKRELEAACDYKCRILINGDIFDAVVSGDRKRFIPGTMIPELEGAKDYVAACVKYARDILAPYSSRLYIIGMGNHEQSFLKFNHANPVTHLITALNLHLADKKSKHRIRYGGIEGFVITRLVSKQGKTDRTHPHTLYYHHGAGGSSPVTGGMIDKARKNEDIDADCITFGHKHNITMTEKIRRGCTAQGNVYFKRVLFLQTGSFLRNHIQRNQEHADDVSYASHSGAPAKPIGGRVLCLKVACTHAYRFIDQFDHSPLLPRESIQ